MCYCISGLQLAFVAELIAGVAPPGVIARFFHYDNLIAPVVQVLHVSQN